MNTEWSEQWGRKDKVKRPKDLQLEVGAQRMSQTFGLDIYDYDKAKVDVVSIYVCVIANSTSWKTLQTYVVIANFVKCMNLVW